MSESDLLAKLLEERMKAIADDISEIKNSLPPLAARVDSLESTRDNARGMWVAVWTIITIIGGFFGIHVAKH